MALRSIQLLAEMSVRNLSGGGGGVRSGRHVRLTTTPLSMSRLSGKCWNLDASRPYGPSWPVKGIDLPFFTIMTYNLYMYHLLMCSVFNRVQGKCISDDACGMFDMMSSEIMVLYHIWRICLHDIRVSCSCSLCYVYYLTALTFSRL
jgi:hypothetical protein